MRWSFVGSVLAVGLAWYLSAPVTLRARVVRLASQPSVQMAFQSDSAKSDALVVLLAFVLGAPMALALLALAVVVLARMVGVVLDTLRLPDGLALPLVVTAVSYGAYVMRGAWLPTSSYVLALVARAYVVFSASSPAFHG